MLVSFEVKIKVLKKYPSEIDDMNKVYFQSLLYIVAYTFGWRYLSR